MLAKEVGELEAREAGLVAVQVVLEEVLGIRGGREARDQGASTEKDCWTEKTISWIKYTQMLDARDVHFRSGVPALHASVDLTYK